MLDLSSVRPQIQEKSAFPPAREGLGVGGGGGAGLLVNFSPPHTQHTPRFNNLSRRLVNFTSLCFGLLQFSQFQAPSPFQAKQLRGFLTGREVGGRNTRNN